MLEWLKINMREEERKVPGSGERSLAELGSKSTAPWRIFSLLLSTSVLLLKCTFFFWDGGVMFLPSFSLWLPTLSPSSPSSSSSSSLSFSVAKRPFFPFPFETEHFRAEEDGKGEKERGKMKKEKGKDEKGKGEKGMEGTIDNVERNKVRDKERRNK